MCLAAAVCYCPAADANVLKVPEGVDDLDAVLLTDILPTAWHANEMGEVGPGDIVAIWGAGPGEISLPWRTSWDWTCWRAVADLMLCNGGW